MILKIAMLALLTASLLPAQARAAAAVPAAHVAKAYFVNIKDGDAVKNPVHIMFGIRGMKIARAGTTEPGTGHFHLLIDTQLTDTQKKLPIPNDPQHMHFGKGQMEATITLAPGRHILQLVMGDGLHRLHKPEVASEPINITVLK